MKSFVFCFALLFVASVPAATLVWDPNDPAPASYNVYIAAPGRPLAMIPVGQVTQHPLTNLVNGVEYTLHVTAVSAEGLESEPSASVQHTPAAGVPPMVVFLPSRVEKAGTNWIVDVDWHPSPAQFGVKDYQVRIYQGTNLYAGFATNMTSLRLTLPIFSPTFVHVWATNYAGASSAAILPLVRPAPPRNVRRSL